MSGATQPRQPFSAVAILAAIVVGLVAFCAMAVLLAYAPELRTDNYGRANALSKSAVGFAGLERALKAMGTPALVSRNSPDVNPRNTLTIITPPASAQPGDTRPFARSGRLLIILPKWAVRRTQARSDVVTRAGLIGGPAFADRLLNPFSTSNQVARRTGGSRPLVRLVDRYGVRGPGLTLGRIDSLQTISGEAWLPVVVDEEGRMVVAVSRSLPNVFVLADPDLLNNQGLSKLDTARAGLGLIDHLRGERAVLMDVTLSGFKRGQAGLIRLMLEPPWLAATLCGLASFVVLFLHALGRFGRPLDEAAAHEPGRRALVENSAAVIRAAGKQARMAPLYAELTWSQVNQAAGGGRTDRAQRDEWLEEMARLRGLESPAQINRQADAANNIAKFSEVVLKLHNWKKEALGGGQ